VSVSRRIGIILLLTLFVAPIPTWSIETIADTPFDQEYHEPYPVGSGADENDVRAIAVDDAGRVWVATKAGIHVLEDGTWESLMNEDEAGPAYDVLVDGTGTVWVAAWNGLYQFTEGKLRIEDLTGEESGYFLPVTQLASPPLGHKSSITVFSFEHESESIERQGEFREEQ